MKPVKRLKTRVSLGTTKQAFAALGRITMYDSIDVSSLPSGAAAYAGYVNGIYDTWDSLVGAKASSGADLLSIDVFGTASLAHCLDVENGDAMNDDIPAWFDRMRANGVKVPVIYTSASNAQAVINVCMEDMKLARTEFLLWSAHYTYSAHICAPAVCDYPAADATQWSNEGPGGCDVSAVASYLFPWTLGTSSPTPPPTPPVPAGPQPYPAPAFVNVDQTRQPVYWEWVTVDGKQIDSYTVQVQQLNGVVVSETVVTGANSTVLAGLVSGWQYNVLVWPNGGTLSPPHATLQFTA